MPPGAPSYSWFNFPFYAPLSGAVSQDFSAMVINGDWQTEAEIFRKEGLGRQIGILSEALQHLIEIIETSPEAKQRMLAARTDASGKNPFAELRTLVTRVDAIKASNREAAQQTAEAAVERAARLNPAGMPDLEARLRGR